MAVLKAYRRALGQCYKCWEKWFHNHTCSPTIQLHVVQELWELLQLQADDDHSSPPPEEQSNAQLFYHTV
jgi:hypothetical protein